MGPVRSLFKRIRFILQYFCNCKTSDFRYIGNHFTLGAILKSLYLFVPLKCLLFVCLFVSGTLLSQQPAYFILGEDQFRGIKIYDIIQDKKLNYWIATNEGLFYFDHYTYKRVECDKAKSSSVFNFVEDKHGVVYCHNLNNQVFRIKDGTFSLFYELEKDEIRSDLSLCVAPDNGLLVGGRKLIHLSEEGHAINKFPVSYYLGPPFSDEGRTVYYQLGGSDSVLVVPMNGEIRVMALHGVLLGKNHVLQFFRFRSSLYALCLRTGNLYAFDPTNRFLKAIQSIPKLERGNSTRLYSTGKQLWVAGTKEGVMMLQDEFKASWPDLFYRDYFISDVYRDREGNILLGTFDKGILVIPDMEIPHVIGSFKEDPVTALKYDGDCGLFIGTSKGALLLYKDNKFRTIVDKGERSIEGIYTSEESPFVIFDNGTIRLYNKVTNALVEISYVSLKDASIVNKNLFYLGTNLGLIKCSGTPGTRIHTETMAGFAFRIYSLVWNPVTRGLYASTSNGLYLISSDGLSKRIMYNDEQLYPSSLACDDGLIYAADKKYGILVIEDDVVKRIIEISGTEREVLSKIAVRKKIITARSFRGLFQFDLNGRLINALSASQGFSGNRVIDFTIQDNILWASHTNGVQRINLNAISKKTEKPSLCISAITVNDSVLKFPTNRLSSTQRKIQFSLCSPTLRNREIIRYHYKLEGTDNRWSVNDVSSNQITYNALAPGNYTFFAKAEKQGLYSAVVSYPFMIDAPFYSKWWFIVFITIVFLTVVFAIYRVQLKLQQKRAERVNELNASKLTAIQSQMNPHFIFNALNSIQNLILKGDVEHSYSYISTFSDLVRRTLNYSDKDFIDFEQEIKLIEIYLSLEQLRFKRDFTYIIDTGRVSDIQIPPMLIQPFIENALAHGLLHKRGAKELKIRFELKDVLMCTIEDNGIGRQRAKAIKERQGSPHESFSVSAIRKRFAILSEVFKSPFGFKYEDLVDPNQEASGTRVVLEIPVKRKY